MKGKFIVFEGLDGAGQTTQARLLHNYLASRRMPVLLTKEPSQNVLGKLAKNTLKGRHKLPLLALELLFTADRAAHLAGEIEPALRNGKTVICDRYLFSTIAFGGLGLDKKFLTIISSKFRQPDAVFLINVPAAVCMRRLHGREKGKKLELFEKQHKLEKVRKNYLALAKQFKNIHVINGNRTKQQVFADVKKIVDKLLHA